LLFFTVRNRPTPPADNDPGRADGKPMPIKDRPVNHPHGGPGVKLEELPVWAADGAAAADLDPSEQHLSRFTILHMKIPTQWRGDPQNNSRRDIGPLLFNYKFAEMWLNYGTWTYTGLTPGKVGPKEKLREWMAIHPDDIVKKNRDKIEMGRSGKLALARCFVLDAKQPTLFWTAVVDTESVVMEVRVDPRVAPDRHGTLIKLFEASILTFRK
jgi:hypothetical protein